MQTRRTKKNGPDAIERLLIERGASSWALGSLSGKRSKRKEAQDVLAHLSTHSILADVTSIALSKPVARIGTPNSWHVV